MDCGDSGEFSFMARIRTIKPDFFLSEDIGSLTVNSRLLYIALWCHVDRDGKAKYNAPALKAQCMLYEMGKFDRCMEELTEKGHALVYEVDGKKYLKIPTFRTHQRPHHTEAESLIPEPNGDITVKERLENGTEGKGKERKGREVCREIIKYLNEKAGKNFKGTNSDLNIVEARLKDYTVDELKAVIDSQCKEWLHTDMAKYLRPETLFRASKFSGYHGNLAPQETDPFKLAVAKAKELGLEPFRGMAHEQPETTKQFMERVNGN